VAETYYKWNSMYLSRDFEMLVFGCDGFPIVLFPPEKGRYFTNKDFGLINSASKLLDSGKIKIYCPDGIDTDSWYNYSIHPSDRIKTHNGYENLILYDVIDFAKHETGLSKVGLAGCGFGAYHALNTAMRHPDLVSSLILLGGFYNIRQFIFGFYNDNAYFNSPLDYLPGLDDSWYLDRIKKMEIIIGTGENDFYLDENKQLSNILNSKQINHWLDVRPNTGHDWNWWREIFPLYLNHLLSLKAKKA